MSLMPPRPHLFISIVTVEPLSKIAKVRFNLKILLRKNLLPPITHQIRPRKVQVQVKPIHIHIVVRNLLVRGNLTVFILIMFSLRRFVIVLVQMK